MDYYYENEFIKPKKFKISYIFIGIIIVIALIFGYIIINKKSEEYLLLKNAKEYVEKNNISIKDVLYIPINKLNVSINNCNELSGVIVDKEYNYQVYLNCKDKKSTIINNGNKYIKLKGEDVVFYSKNNPYFEIGYTSNKEVKINNNISENNNASYIVYDAYENNKLVERLKRMVILIDDDLYNKYYPKIILNGESIVTHPIREIYYDKGVNVIDKVDINLKNKVIMNNSVNYNIDGEYLITYQVTNSRGFTSYNNRKVIVIDPSKENIEYIIEPEGLSNSDKIIKINIAHNDYLYTILPNGNKNTEKSIMYPVSSNGSYLFKVYYKNNRVKEQIININNIDKDKPTGTCNLTTYNDYSIYNVSSSDLNGISKYKYYVNGNYLLEDSSNTYRVGVGDIKSASVEVIDNAMNSASINCNIIDNVVRKQPIVINNSKPYITCGSGSTYNSDLYKYVKYAGAKTREGVVAAAIYLSTLPVRIPYFWSGGHYHTYEFQNKGVFNPNYGDNFIGISNDFGCMAKMSYGGTESQLNGSYYPFGYDCSGFTSWAILNGGYYTGDKEQRLIVYTSSLDTSVGGISNSSSSVRNAKGKMKPGDIVYAPGHVGMVIEVSDSGFKVAEERGYKYGLVISDLSYSTSRFESVILMDNFYREYQKNKPLWTAFK